MPGVHRLQHIKSFPAPDLPDDDPIRAHAQGIDHQFPDGKLPFTFNICRAAFQSDQVVLLQLQLSGILDGDDTLIVGNKAGQHV